MRLCRPTIKLTGAAPLLLARKKTRTGAQHRHPQWQYSSADLEHGQWTELTGPSEAGPVKHAVRPHAFSILRLKSAARSESSMLSAAKMRCRQKSAGGAFVSPKSSSSSSASSISFCRKHSSKPLTVAPSTPGAGTSGNWARAAFKCLAVAAHILSSSFRSTWRGLTNQGNRPTTKACKRRRGASG